MKGFQQKEEVNDTKIFSLIVRMMTIQMVFNVVAVENLHLDKMDINVVFLHGDLDESCI